MNKVKSVLFIVSAFISSCAAMPTPIPTPTLTASPYPTEVKTSTYTEAISTPTSTETQSPTAVPTLEPTATPVNPLDWMVHLQLSQAIQDALSPNSEEIESIIYSAYAFSPDHSLLAIGGCTASVSRCATPEFGGRPFIFVFNTQGGELVSQVPVEDLTITGVAFSADNKNLIFLTRPFEIGIWDIANGKLERSIQSSVPDSNYPRFAVSPEGAQLAVTQSEMLIIFDYATGEKLHEIPGPWGTPEYSANGSRLITYSPDSDTGLVVYKTDTWEETCRQNFLEQPTFTISADGSQFATIIFDKTDTIHIWDSDTCEELSVIGGFFKYVWSMSYSPKEQYLYIAGTDTSTETGGVILWDLVNKVEIGTVVSPMITTNLKFSPDGQMFVSTDVLDVGIWSAITPEFKEMREQVSEFYAALAGNDFEKAATYVALDPETVSGWNLEGVDPTNTAEVLAKACSDNLINCLPIKQILPGGGASRWNDFEVYFTLAEDDGSTHQFSYGTETYVSLARQIDGTYKVVFLPLNE